MELTGTNGSGKDAVMPTICKIDGCDRKIANRDSGLCHMHDLRLKRYGTTERSRNNVDRTQKCIVDGCERNQHTNIGMCLIHYKRFKRLGTTDLPERIEKKCKYCDRKAKARDMCERHYFMWKLHNDPLHRDKKKEELNKYGYKKSFGKYNVRHRAIIADKIGRDLDTNEHVHHIDLDKANNSEENLFLCDGGGRQHAQIHQQLMRTAGELVRIGLIGFKDGEYYIKGNNVLRGIVKNWK